MINTEQLQAVTSWIEQKGGNVTMQSELRGEFPDLHFTFCSDDDVMSDSPVSSCLGFNLYLVDGSNHCLALTGDMDAASGLVVAEIEDE